MSSRNDNEQRDRQAVARHLRAVDKLLDAAEELKRSHEALHKNTTQPPLRVALSLEETRGNEK
jgi:hypothetical protein